MSNPISLRLPDHLNDTLREEAERRGVTLSDVIRERLAPSPAEDRTVREMSRFGLVDVSPDDAPRWVVRWNRDNGLPGRCCSRGHETVEEAARHGADAITRGTVAYFEFCAADPHTYAGELRSRGAA